MPPIAIPSALHDVLGERQSRLAIVLIAAGAVAAVLAVMPAITDVTAWRGILAGLLVADIAAGAIANLTSGTNDYYAARPRHRWIFIAVHVHLPVVALLLGLPLLAALIAWAAVIAAAVIATALMGHSEQRVVAGTLLIGIMCGLPLLPNQQPVLLIISALFAIKVAYSFAVDHRAEARADSQRVGEGEAA